MSVFGCNNYEFLRRSGVLDEKGWPRSRVIALNEFTLTDGAPLNAISSNALGLKQVGSPAKQVIRFAAAATTTDVLRLATNIPSDYVRCHSTNAGERTTPVLRINAKKVDVSGSATDNTDLALTLQCVWNNPAYLTSGTQAQTSGDTENNDFDTVITKTLNLLASAEGADGNPETARFYDFALAGNTTGGMTATQIRNIVPGACIDFILAPNETVGANMAIDIYGAELIYPGHDRISRELDRSIVYF